MLTSLKAKFSRADMIKQEIDSSLNQATVALSAGNFELAAQLIDKVRNAKGASTNSTQTAELLAIQVRSRQGLFTGVFDQLDSLFRKVPRTNVTLQARVGNEMIRVCFRAGNLALGTDRGEKLVRDYEGVWNDADVVELLCQLSSCYFHRGDSARAEELVEKALELAEKIQSPKAMTQSYWQRAAFTQGSGNLSLALRQNEVAKHWGESAGLKEIIPILNSNAALIMLDLPDANLSRIHELAESAYLEMSTNNSPGTAAYVCEILSEVELRREDFERALMYAKKGLQELPPEVPGPKASLLVQVAKVHARLGNYVEAKTDLRVAAEHMEQLEPSRELAQQWGDLARVYVEVGLTDRGVYAYEKAIQMSGLLREEQESKVT